MTHLRAGMTGTTRIGSRFEIFAERDGIWYGRVICNPTKWLRDGSNVQYGDWNILPPAPVKKWRWVMQDANTDELVLTVFHYSTAEKAENGYRNNNFRRNWKAIARIEGSEIRE